MPRKRISDEEKYLRRLAYYEMNKDRINALKRGAYKANPLSEEQKEKRRARTAAWYLENKEKHHALAKAWREKNKERHKKNNLFWKLNNQQRVNDLAKRYRKKHPEKARIATKKWRSKNRDKANSENRKRMKENALYYAVKVAERKANILRAMPRWANKFFIEEVYALARLRSSMKVGGVEKWHVDHIVPLKSDLVCGFHVHNNLRVITAKNNIEKRNKYWPDMPTTPAYAA